MKEFLIYFLFMCLALGMIAGFIGFEIRKYIASILLKIALFVLPNSQFKNNFAVFLYNNIMNL